MLTRRRLIAAATALAAAAAWVAVLSPGDSSSAAPVAPGTTSRVSLHDGLQDPNDAQLGLGGYDQATSATGRFVAFVSKDPDVGGGPGTDCVNPEEDPCTLSYSAVYVRDRQTGQTSQISFGPSTNGFNKGAVRPANGASDYPSISANGRYISFVTEATNIAGAPDTDTDVNAMALVVVCDRGEPDSSGGFPQTPASGDFPSFSCVAVDSTLEVGVDDDSFSFGGNGSDQWPRLQADGAGTGNLRLVWAKFFYLYSYDPIHSDVYTATVTGDNGQLLASSDIGDNKAQLSTDDDVLFGDNAGLIGADLTQPAISADGNTIVVAASNENSPPSEGAFSSGILEYRNVPLCSDGCGSADFGPITPAATGPPSAFTGVERVDLTPGGFAGDPGDPAEFESSRLTQHPQLSDDGNTVVYDTDVAANAGGLFAQPQVYKVDTTARTAMLISQTVSGGSGDGQFPAISADGRYVAFVTDAPGMTEQSVDTLPLGDRSCIGGESLSFSAKFAPALAPTPAPSATGGGGPPVPDRTFCQVIERDLLVNAPAQLVSVSTTLDCDAKPGTSCAGDSNSVGPLSVTADVTGTNAPGALVSWNSNADDLVGADTNGTPGDGVIFGGRDVFVRAWQPVLTGTSIDFGTVPVGTTSGPATLTLSVSGFGPVIPGAASVVGDPDFAISSNFCTGATLHEGESCPIGVTFTPSTSGTHTATISVDPGASVTVTGTGEAASTPPPTTTPPTTTPTTPPPTNPVFTASGTNIDFGTNLPLDLPGKTKSLTITNAGTAPLHITSVVVVDSTNPGASTDYTVDSSGCSSPVPVGGSCTITITFIGHVVGQRGALLSITDDASGSPHLIGMTAVVAKPKVSANPGVIAPGRPTTIEGTGFAPNLKVDIGFKESGEKATATADAKGEFEVAIVIFDHGKLGPRTIEAHTQAVSPTISAEGPLLIALGSVEIPILGSRH